jgi:hypothetical protein
VKTLTELAICQAAAAVPTMAQTRDETEMSTPKTA